MILLTFILLFREYDFSFIWIKHHQNGMKAHCQGHLGQTLAPPPKWLSKCCETLFQAIGAPFPNRLLVQIDTVCHYNCGLVMWASYTGNCHFRELRIFLFFDRLHDNSKGERTAVTSSQNSCVRPSVVLWKSQSKLPSKTLSSLVPTVWHAIKLSLHIALILNGDHRLGVCVCGGLYIKCLVGSVLPLPNPLF